MKTAGQSQHLAGRHQRGIDFFKVLFDDLAETADAFSMETKKKHALLFVDLSAWGGDSVCASASWLISILLLSMICLIGMLWSVLWRFPLRSGARLFGSNCLEFGAQAGELGARVRGEKAAGQLHLRFLLR